MRNRWINARITIVVVVVGYLVKGIRMMRCCEFVGDNYNGQY